MKEIKRYYAHIKNGSAKDVRYSINDNGEWVKYPDHKAVVETMQNKIEELEKENKILTGNLWLMHTDPRRSK